MPDLNPPIISLEANPEFVDSRTCADWLQTLPLINVGPSHSRLLGQLEELNCFNLAAPERIRILELLREPVMFVQSEHAKKFSSKSVPLTRQEREIFNNVLALWDALAFGWQHCMQALVSGESGLSGQAALICQRALWSAGQKIAECYKAYQEFGAAEWRRLHRIYAYAESRGAADQEVSHPAYKGDVEASCAESYVHTLLFALANPHEQTPRQQLLVARWLERWARKIAVSEDPPVGTGFAPLAVDLESSSGASREPKHGGAVRYLHLDEVSKNLRKRLAMLRNGEPPEALGLGEDVPPGLAGQMLVMLYHQWCEDRTARQQSRRVGAKRAQVCTRIADVHYHLTGQPFRQPVETTDLSKKQREEIATFGRVSTRDKDNYVAAQTAALENWNVRDESLAGFCLERPDGAGDSRFMHQQLVAVRPSDAKTFVLCTVRWLSVSVNYELHLGARAMPGVPQGIAIRSPGINVFSEKFVQALALPAVPALQISATLVIPSGWFRPKRLIEIRGDKSQQVLLSALLERGSDFERCTFETADSSR